MTHPEFVPFVEVIGSLLSVRGNNKKRALSLRQTLGSSIDRRLSRYPKGTVRDKKTQFVLHAKALTGVNWRADEPHQIISTLKNSGQGDEQMARALLFLCFKTSEFRDVSGTLLHVLKDDAVDLKNVVGWPPTFEYTLVSLLGRDNKIKYIQRGRQIVPILNTSNENTAPPDTSQDELRSAFRYIIDKPLGYEIDRISNTPEALPEILVRKRLAKQSDDFHQGTDQSSDAILSGRMFVENHAGQFIAENSGKRTGTLSIIDIDDLTKINKVHGIGIGDTVISAVELIVQYSVEELKYKTGRCGDDTFFVALADHSFEETLAVMKKVRSDISAYEWRFESPGLSVTVSIGIVERVMFEDSIDLAIRAGLAMNYAKFSGRSSIARGPNSLPGARTRYPASTVSLWS